VFRRTLTADIYGDPVTIDAGEPATAAYTTTVDDAWKSENLAVVVFVSNPSGIVQVIKTTL
jgi:ethanolamine utilization microcompartment shell protein EutL